MTAAAKKVKKKVSVPKVDSEYEGATIRRALAGDHEAGREALRLCRAGLDHGTLSRPLAAFLAERLWEIDKALEQTERLMDSRKDDGRSRSTIRSRKAALIEQALRIAPGKKPRDPIPDWQTPLAAFGIILLRAGMRREKVNDAMSEARTWYSGRNPETGDPMKALQRKEAYAILRAFAPMRSMSDDDLLHLAGPLRELLPTHFPQT